MKSSWRFAPLPRPHLETVVLLESTIRAFTVCGNLHSRNRRSKKNFEEKISAFRMFATRKMRLASVVTILYIVNGVFAQDCSTAPTKALKKICEQLTKMDKNARANHSKQPKIASGSAGGPQAELQVSLFLTSLSFLSRIQFWRGRITLFIILWFNMRYGKWNKSMRNVIELLYRKK